MYDQLYSGKISNNEIYVLLKNAYLLYCFSLAQKRMLY